MQSDDTPFDTPETSEDTATDWREEAVTAPWTHWYWEKGVGGGHVDKETPDAILRALIKAVFINVEEGHIRLWTFHSDPDAWPRIHDDHEVILAARRILQNVIEGHTMDGGAPIKFHERLIAEARRYRRKFPASDFRGEFDESLIKQLTAILRGEETITDGAGALVEGD